MYVKLHGLLSQSPSRFCPKNPGPHPTFTLSPVIMFPQDLKTRLEVIMLASEQTIPGIKLHKEPRKKCKISQDELSHAIKIATDFNVVNSVRHENKVLALKTHYTVCTNVM